MTTPRGQPPRTARDHNRLVAEAMAALAPRRTPKQARGRMTVEAILDAAGVLLVEDGPDALTVDAVAARAGVSVGAVYGFFPNKYGIVNALAARSLRRLERAFEDVELPLRDDGDWQDRLLTVVDRLAVLWADPVDVVVWNAMWSTPEMRLAGERYDEAFGAVLADFIRPGLPELTDAEAAVVGRVLGEVIRSVLDLSLRVGRQDAAVLAELRAVILGYLRARAERT